MSNLDDKDRELIALLRKDARMPVVNLAKQLKVSRATVQNRISKLEKLGVILGYTVILSEDTEQSQVEAIISICVAAKDENNVLKNLQSFPEVLSVYHTNGKWDLIANLRSPNLSMLGGVLGRIRSIEGIEQTEANLLINKIF
ncbi:Lrp/AsnC family transcriptional regulator [Vibrio sp. D404a]|uniref:Lrp/AsnC family transcriptional regulator n=1 Tax=unclassified Vibrio TaxID=2614977 RepID=UPI0025538DC4|nr:Lrp/AsnC family transcriptional regulator [Vibrio sp. D404a]MDK9798650.1 Lrp/AsnC family transcriptional regulator [Vibrio sp. D449a]